MLRPYIRDFVDSEFAGVVTLKLLRAKGLPARDVSSLSIPCTLLSCNAQKRGTPGPCGRRRAMSCSVLMSLTGQQGADN